MMGKLVMLSRSAKVNVLRASFLVVSLVMLAVALPSMAQDCGTPSVGVPTYVPDASGNGTLSVTYSFPNANSGNYLQLWIDGTIQSTVYPSTQTGTWSMALSSSCWATGSHAVGALAVSCGRWWDAQYKAASQIDVMVDTTPKITSIQPTIDYGGSGTVAIGYEFPNTQTYLDRWLELWIGENRVATTYADALTGTWTPGISTTCLASGQYALTVRAYACSKWSDPLYLAEASTTLTVNTKPDVSGLAAAIDPDSYCNISAQYAFPNTVSHLDRWLDLSVDGVSQNFDHPATSTGTYTYTFGTQCLAPGPHTINLFAASCSKYSDERFTDLATTSITIIPPTIDVALNRVAPLPGTQRRAVEARFEYTLGTGATRGVIRPRVSKWVAADGTTYAGYNLAELSVTTPSGVATTQFTPASGARWVEVVATVVASPGPVGASSCTRSAAGRSGIQCLECDYGASKNPVYYADGNMRLSDTDPLPPLAGHALTRTYDSDEQTVGLFGRGWTSIFERRLIVDGTDVSVVSPTNDVAVFSAVGSEFRQVLPTFQPPYGTLTHDAVAGTYTHRSGGSLEAAVFNASDGRLLRIRDLATGREAVVGYDANGIASTLTDSWTGTQWVLTIQNRLITSIAVAGRPDLSASYTHDANGNLTAVRMGSEIWRAYDYSADRMTASHDALGHLIESHAYDADGYAIDSTGPDDEISGIQYRVPGSVEGETVTRVTYRTGAIAEYVLRPSGGTYRVVQARGGCASCGAGEVTFVRDDYGRIVRSQGADGYVTVSTYENDLLRSVQTAMRIAGCDPQTDTAQCRASTDVLAAAALEATTASVTTAFEYNDPIWPDKVTAVQTESVLQAGGFRRTETSYHPVYGTVTASTTRGWSGAPPQEVQRTTVAELHGGGSTAAFDPGGSFSSAWLSLPQPAGTLRSTDGPRTSPADVTSYVYYPLDASVPALLRGRLAASRNALGQVTRYETYDVFGNPTRIVDANGVAAETAYDALGRLVSQTIKGQVSCDTVLDPLCATDLTSTRTYFGAGPLSTDRAPTGDVTVYGYDARGRVATISRGPSENDLRERIETTYDPATGKKSVEKRLAFDNGSWIEKHREAYAYDVEARLKTITHADGAAVHYAYDAADRVASARDENHAAPNTFYRYDSAGRLATVTQLLGTSPAGQIVTSYAYDRHGNLTSVADPNGNTTTYLYDDLGQMIRQTSPVTGVTAHEYDPAGLLTKTTDANGAVTVRIYDALGRALTSTSTKSGSSETVTWTYDSGTNATGRLSAITDPTGSTVYAYERRGMLALEQKTIGSATYTTRYAYDASGNRSRIAYPSGRVATYTFDFSNRPLTVSVDGAPIVSNAKYLPFGPATELSFANGTTKSQSYDARYRPLTNALTGPAGALASYSYAYDPAGNVTSIADQLAPAYNRTFGYDDVNRLVTANSGAALWGAGSYAYDSMGNLQSYSLGTRAATFQYQDTTPKLLSANEDGSVRGVSYDAAGNELTAGSTGSSYSPRNQLVSSGAAAYAYDGRGLRVVTSRVASALVIASLGTDKPSPQKHGTTVTWTAQATGGLSPIQYRFARKRSSAADWVTVQDWSGVNSVVWTPAGSDVGDWNVRVEARSAGAIQSEASLSTSFTVTDPIVVTALTANLPSPQPQGTTIVWTTQATGGVAPLEYRYWKKSGSSSTWNMVRDWSQVSTYSWTPTLADVGAHEFHVNVRSAGATESEAYRSTTFMISAGETIVVTSLAANLPSPQPYGTTITWNAMATGGIAPLEYRYWSKASSTTVWNMVRDWSQTSTYAWTPGPADVGSWEIHVNVRSAGVVESEAYRTSAAFSVTVPAPIVVTSLAADLPSPQRQGTTITWNTAATGGIAPLEYRYWRKSGSSPTWTMIRDWSQSSTYVWTPVMADVGPHEFHVNVRSAGGTESEAYRSASYTISAGEPIVVSALTADRPSPQPQQASITWTPQVAGGIEPLQYRYWMKNSSGPTWTMTRDWSTTRTFTWTPGSADLGSWNVHVNVRSAGVTESEAYATSPLMTVVSCSTELPPPSLPAGEVVWVEDAMPGPGVDAMPWTTAQKASGLKSIWLQSATGAASVMTNAETPSLTTTTGDRLSFSMLLNTCAMPRTVRVEWYSIPGGWLGVWWGEALLGGEAGFVHQGPIPAGGTWTRFEFPSSLLGLENRGIGGLKISWYGGEGWLDRFALVPAACVQPQAPSPVIPAEEVPWIDDTVPAQHSDLPWSTVHKASGTRSVWIENGTGPRSSETQSAAPSLTLVTGDRLSFYMLLNQCSMPRALRVEWSSTTSGWKGVWWGESLLGQESSYLYQGAIPAGGGWTRFEIAASALGIEAHALNGIRIRLYDGEGWFDRFAVVPQSFPASASKSFSLETATEVPSVGGTDGIGLKSQPRVGSPVSTIRSGFVERLRSWLGSARVPASLGVTMEPVAAAVSEYRRYSLYTPELQLMAETEITTSTAPAIAWEYVWFGGQPVAQIASATGAIEWTFTDHLGTPLLQTNAAAQITWRAEYEPYGTIHTLRAGTGKHQPLRFPGQEAEEGGEVAYNIFRWYRAGWGRYTQADPLGDDIFRYAASNPITYSDPRGLYVIKNHPTVRNIPQLAILDEYCDADTGGACTANRLAWVECPCNCAESGYKMDVTMHFRFTIYAFSGFWPELTERRRAHHSVTDRASAIAHEYAYHIDPAHRMIGSLLEAYEAPLYSSEAECNAACKELRGSIQREFESLLSFTQRAEARGGDPTTFGR